MFDKSGLNEKGLDYIGERFNFFRYRHGQGIETDGASGKFFNERSEEFTVHEVQPEAVDF